MKKHTNQENFVSALVGNKLDALEAKPRMVEKEQVEAIAEENGMILCETSALTGTGI